MTQRTIHIASKFKLGKVLMTWRVIDACLDDPQLNKVVIDNLRRHASGDWGDILQEYLEGVSENE